MPFFHIDPSASSQSIDLSSSHAGGHIIAVRIVGSYSSAGSPNAFLRTWEFDYNGQTFYADPFHEYVLVPVFSTNQAVEIYNQDGFYGALSDYRDTDGDYGLEITVLTEGATVAGPYEAPLNFQPALDIGLFPGQTYSIDGGSYLEAYVAIAAASTLNVVEGAILNGPVLVGSGGTLYVNGATVAGVTIGGEAESPGVVVIEDGGFLPSFRTDSSGSGQLMVTSGSKARSGPGFSADIFGNEPGSRWSASITGAGSEWTTTSKLIVGFGGSGAVYISDGAVLQTGTIGSTSGLSLDIGAAGGGLGVVSVNGSGLANVAGRVGVGNGGDGMLSITTGGTVQLGAPQIGFYSVYLGNSSSSTGTLDVDGAGSKFDGNGGPLGVGLQGRGLLRVQNGGTVSVGVHDVLINKVGASPGGQGTVSVSGIGSLLNATGQFDVGSSGTGNLVLSLGAVMNVGSFPAIDGGLVIGNFAGSAGFVTLDDGAILTSYGGIRIGRGGRGIVSVTNGARMTSELTIGDIDAGQHGIAVGLGNASSGTLAVSGFGSTAATNADISVGAQGAGAIDVNSGGTVIVGTSMALGFADASLGVATVTVTGVGSILIVGTGLDIGFAPNSLPAGVGSLFATSGGEVSVTDAIAISAGSTLGVDGSSIVEVGGSNHATRGAIVVNANGTLSGAGVVFGDIVVNGAVDSTGGRLVLSGAVSGTGLLTISGDATLEMDDSLESETRVEFDGFGGVLAVKQADLVMGSIGSFRHGNTIDLLDVVADYQNYDPDSGILYVGISTGAFVATPVAALQLEGNYRNSVFLLTDDGHGGTNISLGGLFTTGNDTVDFNRLAAEQIEAVTNGADLYHSLQGDDVIILPDVVHASDLDGIGKPFEYGAGFSAGPGSDTLELRSLVGLAGYAADPPLRISGGDEPVGGADVLLLPGRPGDYRFCVRFPEGSITWEDTTTSVQNGTIEIVTDGIEKAEMNGPIANPVTFDTHGGLYNEAALLAKEVYGPLPTGGRPAEPLAFEPGRSPDSTTFVSEAAKQRGWHDVSAIELGMRPADFGSLANGLQYSLVNGFYQARQPNALAVGLFHDLPEANALVLTGAVEGIPTLMVVFRGTDQAADFADYPDFVANHYGKFAPLVGALQKYVAAQAVTHIDVVGHSLGASMAQLFARDIAGGGRAVQVITFGSPGAEQPAEGVSQINFVRTDDPVPQLGLLTHSSSAETVAIATSLLVPYFGLVAAPVLAAAALATRAKYISGPVDLLNSEVSSRQSFDEHAMGDRVAPGSESFNQGYINDIRKMELFAADPGSPFHFTGFASDMLHGIVTNASVPRIAVGPSLGETPTMNTYDGDEFVLGDPGVNNRIIWHGTREFLNPWNTDDSPTRIIDGGDAGLGNTLMLPSYVSWSHALTPAVDAHGLPYNILSGIDRISGTPVSGSLYRIATVVDRGFSNTIMAPSSIAGALSDASSADPARLVIHLDGTPTSVQRPIAGQATLLADGISDVAYGGASVTDIESDAAWARIVYGSDAVHVNVTGAGSIVVSDGTASTTQVTIDTGGSDALVQGGPRPLLFIGYLGGASFDGDVGTATLDYSAIAVGLTLDLAHGLAQDAAGNFDSFISIDTFRAPSAGTSTIKLAAVGSAEVVAGIGTSYIGFAAVTVGAAASWSMGGTNVLADAMVVSLGMGSTLDVAGAIVGSVAFVMEGATLRLPGTVDPASVIHMQGIMADHLTLAGMAGQVGFAGTITDMQAQDLLVLEGITFATGATAAYSPAEATLTVLDGDIPVFTFAHLSAASGAAPGFTVSGSTIQVACFVAGTRIGTIAGEVEVEDIRIGDRVRSAFGGSVEVVWLGHRRVRCCQHVAPPEVWPVHVQPGAFGPDLPHRDLWLSPDHSVFIDGVLIPIRYLINGATIVQETRDEVTYWHVELSNHDVLFAEGLPCESYLDTGNRAAFANGGPAIQLHPDFALNTWKSCACAPLVRSGAELEAARSWLLECAGPIGHLTTADPQLAVVADGCHLRVDIIGRQRRVRLPPGTQSVRFASRTWVPAHTHAAATDTRSLGVAISRLWFDNQEIALTGRELSSGWYEPEPGWRWTDGYAALELTEATDLSFEVAMTGIYWENRERRGIPMRDLA